MVVYCFYLFDRSGTCLCYREWNRPRRMLDSAGDQANMFGMLFALRQFCMKLSPGQEEEAEFIGTAGSRGLPRHFITANYALHYFETATGLRFVLTTSKDFRNEDQRRSGLDLTRSLKEIWSEIYVNYVCKNPMHEPGSYITSELFLSKLDAYVKQLPCYNNL